MDHDKLGPTIKSDVAELSDEEIALRMNNAVRRALNTPPTPLKKVVGKRKRAPTGKQKKRAGKDALAKTPS